MFVVVSFKKPKHGIGTCFGEMYTGRSKGVDVAAPDVNPANACDSPGRSRERSLPWMDLIVVII